MFRHAVILGLLIAVGPFAIDAYLPAFASIAADFGRDQGVVQLSVLCFMATLAAGQVIYGPISDAVGRKRPVYFGLCLFVVGSIGCALAGSIEQLLAWRAVQGLGASAGMVLAIAIIRDMHDGVEAARLLSTAILALSVSPILAPLAGGAIIQVASWRVIFWALGLVAIAVGVLLATSMHETLPPARRLRPSLGNILSSYLLLLRDRTFLSAVGTGGFAQASLLAYVAGSSFLFITLYGTTPLTYSLIFAGNAATVIGLAQLNAFIINRIGVRRLLTLAVAWFVVATLIMCAVVASGQASLTVAAVLIFLSLASLGMIMPIATMLALEPMGAMAGTASALSGFLQGLLSALATLLVGASFDGTARPMVIVMALSGLCCTASWLVHLASSPCRAAQTA
ncbi:MAG TPA: multidrug effflux MFS transporter [Geminicoccus sp.]|uniref:multidrug effflux MFS transporter n=1 Tax=Geminicoccus sp. TaxID=2024832 RepID=UPI002E33DFA8|nr:multidrug effflux MFS transporter [Geminicoccus sp.]HEX2525652.1 multidrug effflux MFS transporter [Geminicoccus sp.]